MGIENKTYRKNFQTFDDKSFILDDFDDELDCMSILQLRLLYMVLLLKSIL